MNSSNAVKTVMGEYFKMATKYENIGKPHRTNWVIKVLDILTHSSLNIHEVMTRCENLQGEVA